MRGQRSKPAHVAESAPRKPTSANLFLLLASGWWGGALRLASLLGLGVFLFLASLFGRAERRDGVTPRDEGQEPGSPLRQPRQYLSPPPHPHPPLHPSHRHNRRARCAGANRVVGSAAMTLRPSARLLALCLVAALAPAGCSYQGAIGRDFNRRASISHSTKDSASSGRRAVQ